MYFRVEFDGTACIMTGSDLFSFLNDIDDEIEYIISKVHYTKEEYENLPEFKGF